MSNWEKQERPKTKTKSIVFTSLLCLGVPWSLFKKIFENIYSFFHNSLSTLLFYLLLRQFGKFIPSEQKTAFSLGFSSFTTQNYTVYLAMVFTSPHYLLFYSLSYFSFSESFTLLDPSSHHCIWFINIYKNTKNKKNKQPLNLCLIYIISIYKFLVSLFIHFG